MNLTRGLLSCLLLPAFVLCAGEPAAKPQAPIIAATTPAGETWQVDAAHSTLGFEVAHLGIATVSGHFKTFESSLVLDGKRLVSATATIDAASVFTDNAKRDEHLRGEDFFDTAKFPKITFVTTAVTQEGGEITVRGDLTMHGVTKPVTLKGRLSPVVRVEAWKVDKVGLRVKGTLNRKDFGLKFNQLLGTGEAMVGDEVDLDLRIEANRPY